MAETMHHWRLDKVGRDHLRMAEAPIPRPGPRQILVKVGAASLNFRDKLVIENGMGLNLPFPLTPGSDMAGSVVATGTEVKRFREGDRVISCFAPGWLDGDAPGNARTPSYATLGGVHQGVIAEYVAIDQEWAVAAPQSLTDAEASTLPCAGLTSWFGLVELGHLHAGETVVVQGTGGVALLGLQIAAAQGAEVIVTSGDDKKLARAVKLGARHGINRVKEDWVEAVYRLTGDRGADHILEIAGGANLGRSIEAAAIGGHISVIGVLEGFEVSGKVVPLMLKHLTIQGIGVGHRRALEDLVRAVDRCAIKPVIDAEYKLADLPAALDHLTRGPFGKIVIRM